MLVRRWTLALSSSVAAVATASASPAWAQCAPNPVVADTVTICSGLEENGLIAGVKDAKVIVDYGATVSGPGRGSIIVQFPAQADSFGGAASEIIVRGTVTGANSGIYVIGRPAGLTDSYYSTLTASAIIVEQGGSISGSFGISVNPVGGYYNDWAWVMLSNSGTISGTSGIALQGNNPASGRFESIYNSKTGVIGAIQAQVGLLANQGLIDGGAISAISDLPEHYAYSGQGTIANSGIIRSSGSAATIFQYRNFNPGNYVENAGLIENLGSGAGIAGNTIFYLDNGANGIIRAASGAAITAPAYLSIRNSGRIESPVDAIATNGRIDLTNTGTIAGNVISTTGNRYDGSIIDNRGGLIDGDVRLGAGDDVFIADATGIGTITGQLDAGDGVDTLRYLFLEDTTLGSAMTVPATFEQLAVWVGNSSTLTLGPDFASSNTITVGGGDRSFFNPENRFINQGLIDTNGPALVSDNGATGGLTVNNDGTIRARLINTDQFAVDLGNESYFSNSGAISAIGGGAVRITRGNAFANSGDILADGTAVITTIALANSGTIRSTAGLGVDFSHALNGRSTNSGLIEGATVGARIYYATLVNNGTIGSAGTALEFGYSGNFYNESGAIVRGGMAAVRQSSVYPGSGGSLLSNAGLIIGDVDFGNGGGGMPSSNIFVARPGGMLDGDLNLGSGNDTLVTNFVNDGPGQFAGVSGIVTGNGSENLRYIIDGTFATDVGRTGIFRRMGYDLVTGSSLTLSASSMPADTLTFAGQGSVDLNADMSASLSDPLIRLNAASYVTDAGGLAIANAVTLVSHGTLSKTMTDPFALGAPLIAVSGENSFENAGTITVTGAQYYRLTAIAGGGTIINSGTIEISRADAFNGSFYSAYDKTTVINSGTIREATGGEGSARGIINANTLVNSGTIDMGNTAVAYGYLVYGATLSNSGLIRSANGAAISSLYYAASIRNDAAGTIQGGVGNTAISLNSGQISNAGIIKGDVRFGDDYFGGPGVYIADGGTIEGNLYFSSASDILLQIGDNLGVTGTVDGGVGQDMFGRVFATDATVNLGARPDIGFEHDYLLAQAGATVSIDAAAQSSNILFVGGEGSIVNLATLDGGVSTDIPYYYYPPIVAAYLPRELTTFINRGAINGGFAGRTVTFDNEGSVGISAFGFGAAVIQYGYGGDLNFANRGTITGGAYGAIMLSGQELPNVSFHNDGQINGSLTVDAAFAADAAGRLEMANAGQIDGSVSIVAGFAGTAAGNLAFNNSGTLRFDGGDALAISNYHYLSANSGHYAIDNNGLIESAGTSSAAIRLSLGFPGDSAQIINNWTIRTTGDGVTEIYSYPGYEDSIHSQPTATITLQGYDASTLTLSNMANGVIESTGNLSTVILVADAALALDNAGTIRGGSGTLLAATDDLALALGAPYLAGAIQTVGNGADSIQNSGTIIGSIDLGAGDDVIVNRGTIIGDVYLRDGNDSFTLLASAIMQGIVDGGAGTDSFIVDATGGGAINADQFVNFERFLQIGEGNVTYSGDFSFNTIGLDGGTVTVAAGETLSSAGAFTITGGAGNDSVRNAGTISGGIDLAGGNDSIVNNGIIGGPVLLGAGNDSFTEGAGSSAGLVDGGAGTDLYRVILAGDRSGIGAQTGFEQLSIEGQGTLTLGLGQGYDAIALLGTNLNLATNGQFVGQILGSDGQEQLRLTSDVSAVQLGAGNDALTFDPMRAAGRYDGGAGQDSLTFTAQGPVTLAGTATGFETLSLAGGHLIVTGQLGSADGALRFGDAGEQLDIAAGGRLLGQIDMGGGDDIVRLADGALWQGILSGGAGHDSLSFGLSSARTLDGNSLTGFEALLAQGSGTLTLVNGFTLQSLNAQGNLTLASGASLTTDKLTFGDGDNRFTINGLFAGAVDGGAGSNRILLNGGSASAPVRFSTVSNIAGLDVSGGYATVSGSADFGIVDLSGGRLVGLAGSTIRGSSILVRQGATFGSAGTVVGDIHVAGTLSPGASPGTMTVTGNVALAGGSTTLMEITPMLSDQLVISGTLTIAQGASLVLSADQQIKPGTTLDLIIAHGGISGSYTNIVKPDTLFGFIVQDDERIRLLGQFLNNGSYTPQVQRAIDYTNVVIASGTASEGLIDALPVLATASGASNPAAFARLTAEPYASATQMGVENGLAIANSARSIARLSADEAPRAFAIGQYLGGLGRISADDQAGLSASRSRSYGLLGGLGIGTDHWSIAGFGGYLDSRQMLRQLGSQTDADGWLAGLAGSYALGALRFDATLAYHQLDADTDRLTPEGSKAHGRFRLKNWIGDLSLSYEAALGSDWAARPDIGLTYVATTRTGFREESSNVWALDVARDHHDALFADGGVAFGRSRASDARFRPFVRLGVQYQLQGRGVEALAGFMGTDQSLMSLGARRGGLIGSVSGGAEMRVGSALSLFANASQTYSQDDRRASANIGMRFAF